MTLRSGIVAASGLAGLLLAVGAATPALAKKDCGAWNNWCRPACGDWNAWCAGQSLPDVLSRTLPRSYFADPKWQAPNYLPPEDDKAAGKPERKRRAARQD
jgi:hypothetical protein